LPAIDLPFPERLPRAALVTGGARRIGRAITLALAGAGFDVAIHVGTARAEAEELAGEIAAAGRRALVLEADLASEDHAQALFPAARALGPIGLLVNNASAFERDEWANVTRASWDRHLEPNLRAPFVLAQHFAKALPPAAEGLVVNLLDERVWALTPHFVSYTLSKTGLWTLTRTLALAFAPRIRVAAIGPGPTLPSTRQTDEQFVRQLGLLPLKRGPTPEEVARAVLMILALPSFTGQMLALDGGQHLRWTSPAVAVEE
jgi:NAD(P)-dependent dehydrogenase (short-subunit alcohol dehydrogenase family)